MNKNEKIIIEYHKMGFDTMAKTVFNYHTGMRKKKGLPVKGHRIAYAHTIRHTAKHFHMSVGSAHALVKRGETLYADKNAGSSKQYAHSQDN